MRAASPLVLHAVNPITMAEDKHRDVAILINTGFITCYSGTGD
jgi:hypothetical protein